LITPSVRAVGLTITGDLRRETAQLRQDEPWFPAAFAALEAIVAGKATDDWKAIAPFSCGRWNQAAQAHRARAQWPSVVGGLSVGLQNGRPDQYR
jgi:proline iminopeptidase